MIKKKNIGVILAAGIGSRFQADRPKQFYEINNKEVIAYSIEVFKKVSNMDAFFVVLGQKEIEDGFVKQKYNVNVVTGGESRAESFDNALKHIKLNYPDCEKVIFHEAARPLVAETVFEKYFDLLENYDYVETCKHITDSLGSYLPIVPRREDYYLIQAPEAYRFNVLIENFDVASEKYFAAHQLPTECKGYKCFDVKDNLKLTYPDDAILLGFYLDQKGSKKDLD